MDVHIQIHFRKTFCVCLRGKCSCSVICSLPFCLHHEFCPSVWLNSLLYHHSMFALKCNLSFLLLCTCLIPFLSNFSVFYAQWFFQAKVAWMFTMIYPESFSHKQCQIICVAQLCSNAFQFLLLYLVIDGWRLNCVFLGISNPKFLKCALTLLDAHFPFCLAKCGCFQFYFFFAFRVWHSKRMRWWKRNLPARQGFKHVSAFLVPFLKYVLTM